MSVSETEYDAAKTALSYAVTIRSDGDSAAKVVTTAKRFYKFLTQPDSGREETGE